jgi:hypothetical protein
MINVTVPNFDNVREELTKALSKMSTDKFVTVGVHESDTNRGESMTNATLGAIQHFGNDNIPARPWLDTGVASVTDEIVDTIADSAEDGESIEQALERVGVVAVAGVQNYMDELQSPGNAASTIAKKGDDNPLIDSGELKQSVTYKVTTGKPSEGL